MTPIEKNILVVDEQGNEYEATYPKRAKGLVKNGRARFVTENSICLACPPKKSLEDNEMNDIDENAQNITEITGTKNADTKCRYSLDYALEQIEKLAASTAYLDNAISELRQMKTSNGPGDIATQAKAMALADVVKCRETTNQRLLDFYVKMVNDLKDGNMPKSNTVARLDELSKWLATQNKDEYDPQAWSAMLDAVKAQMLRNY